MNDTSSITSMRPNLPAVAQPHAHLPRAEDFLLWPPSLQAYGYRIVDRLFASRVIHKAPKSRPLLRGSEIAPQYLVGDQKLGVDGFMDRNHTAGLLVIKDGSVRLERYGLGLGESDRWSTMSTVKSMTAMLAGAAVQDGHLHIENSVATYLNELRGTTYEHVRVRDLLTMSSGVAWDENYSDKHSDVNKYSKSLADKVPGGVLQMMGTLPRLHEAGTRWHYNTGDTFLLGAAICAAVGKPLADYMTEKVWHPWGMEFDAFYTLESDDGQEIGGSRAGMALRDFGRFASFVMNDGMIDDQRVLPEGWVQASNQPRFQFNEDDKRDYPQITSGNLVGYGYSWWIDKDGAMLAVGFAGQRIYIDRQAKLIIVTLSAWPQKGYVGEREHDHVAELALFTQAIRRVC